MLTNANPSVAGTMQCRAGEANRGVFDYHGREQQRQVKAGYSHGAWQGSKDDGNRNIGERFAG
jgi:hypothetical protein